MSVTSAPEPRANADLAGHEAAEAEILQAWSSDRMPHAWLIGGPKGIGKATLAFRVARFALAQGGRTLETPSLLGDAPTPSGLAIDPSEPMFQRIASGGHLDLVTVERRWDEKRGRYRAEILVEDVRKVRELTSRTAGEGGWRAVVVDAADEMNVNAANALLKVLEEPPDKTLLLLVAHNPGRIMPTLRSRCRKLTLRRLSDDTVTTLLNLYAPELPADDVRMLVPLSGGSIGRALTLAEQGGGRLHRDLLGLLQGLPRLDIGATQAFGERLSKPDSSEAFVVAMDLLRSILADIVRTAATGVTGEAAVGGAGSDVIGRLAGAGSLDRWLEVWEKTTALLARVDNASLDRKQVVLTLFTNLQSAARA